MAQSRHSMETSVKSDGYQFVHGQGARVAWTIPIGSRISTNLAAAELTGEDLVVDVGTAVGTVLLWPPE
ncbi:MAG: hypothetical protein JSV89_02015 [Spirochaetaceae bacterium]|nr:MAG: hypothetical protein JSV89_02015 [Spirochaetaceae bacterium]